jgi:casein kinase II subunit beta
MHQDATEVYGLLHARFILTPLGLGLMREKMLQGRFGTCPKVFCEQSNAIPIGLSNTPKTSRVKIYCPRCKEVYFPKRKGTDVDGAYFGSSFPLILLQAYPDLQPTKKSGSF